MSSAKYENNHIFSYKEVWLRVTSNTDINNQGDLAKVVGVTQSAVSLRKSKDIWPEEWAYRIGRKYNLLTEWILTAEGPKRLDDLQGPQNYNFSVLKDLDQWLTDLVVNEPNRREWFKISVQDAFPMFKQWMKRRENKERKDTDISSSNVI